MSLLLVDSYDSFTCNLKHLVEAATGAKVVTIHNDSYSLPEDSHDLDHLINTVDAIIIGPGPGSPNDSQDIGIIPYIYKKFTGKPILGICLGFQTLCLQNGESMGYLAEPIHGQIHQIDILDDSDLFKGFPNHFDSVRYHSIFIDTPKDPESSIKPLAFHTDEETGEKFLMAARHTTNPHFGVQYHPESICSTWGEQLITNFWNLCQINPSEDVGNSLLKDIHVIQNVPFIEQYDSNDNFDYQFKKLDIPSTISILDICDSLHKNDCDTLLLNSAFTPGEWSIIGLPITSESEVITHSTESPKDVILSTWKSSEEKINQTDSIFEYIAQYMAKKHYQPNIINSTLVTCPFVGGLIGYISYEEGQFIQLEKLQKLTKSNIDDTKLCFIERFIAINQKHEAFIVSIRKNDSTFINDIYTKLGSVNQPEEFTPIDTSNVKINTPDKDQYFKAFHKAQEYLKSGNSYELCLTCPTTLHFPQENNASAWDIYKTLVKRNPSPYSAFLDFGSSNLLSTSPERFISWNKESCEMRPIKGTLRKGSGIDMAEATKRLKIPKEMGENLMIVDLIRHDLFTLLENVTVEKLMTVEEYHTLFQLVSVIKGTFNPELKFKGIDVLSHCLPPGSMTGAPKKRSVELLHELENNARRGLYSGVCGYYSVNDVADWSVIIRSIFSYGDDLLNENGERVFRCGAGGALTVLSTDEGEWDEMHVKFDSVLQLFK